MRYYLVTGCDSGFGLLSTRQLVQKGHTVFAGVYDFVKSSEALHKEFGSLVVALALDVTNEESIRAALMTVSTHLQKEGAKGLDGLCNNAGVLLTPGPFEWTPTEAYRKMMDVNLIGLAAVTRAALPLLRRARGRIVNVSSMAARVGLPNQPAYCASKFAVEGLTQVLRREMRVWGISVHLIEPGVFNQTALYAEYEEGFARLWEGLPEDVKHDYGEKFYRHNRKGLGFWVSALGSRNKDPAVVADCIVHALTSPSPKYRYKPGFDSKYAIGTLVWLPDSLQDLLLSSADRTARPATAPHPSAARWLLPTAVVAGLGAAATYGLCRARL